MHPTRKKAYDASEAVRPRHPSTSGRASCCLQNDADRGEASLDAGEMDDDGSSCRVNGHGQRNGEGGERDSTKTVRAPNASARAFFTLCVPQLVHLPPCEESSLTEARPKKPDDGAAWLSPREWTSHATGLAEVQGRGEPPRRVEASGNRTTRRVLSCAFSSRSCDAGATLRVRVELAAFICHRR